VKIISSNHISSLQSQLRYSLALWPLVCAVFLVLVAVPNARAVNNGLARTPPMGWNSWNHYGCGINETIVKQIANTMATNGMKAAGYEYVNLDDCWMATSRTSSGALIADPTKFPDGMAAVAAYVHSLGLKIGLYEDVGTATCQGRPGSYGHYAQDVATYISWGIDYIKMDWCNTSGLDPQTQYTQFEEALTAANAQIDFSICDWGVNDPWLWGPSIGNSWRTTGDIGDNWTSMVNNLESNAAHASYAGPGGWNDPDMLEVGNGGMSAIQDQTHFAMWAMSAAPLIAGNDLVGMSSTTLATLTNANIIAIDQDPLGIQGTIVSDNGSGLQVWSKEVTNGIAVALFNNSSSTSNMTVQWSGIGLSSTQSVSVTNLWSGQNLGSFTGSYTTSVPSENATILMIEKSGACTPTAIVPYISVNGGSSWAEESAATVSSTSAAVDLGPQPISGGSWSWSGPSGYTSTSRQINSIPLSTGINNYVATYTNTSSCKSTQTFAITVSGSTSGFSLTPSASTLSVKQGASGTDKITVADTGGFTGSVAFTVSGLPNGVTASFSPASSASSSVLTLTASSSATTGAFTVTVTGTSGSTTASTTFTLDVTTSVTGSACTVDYTINPQSSSNFGANITIKNGGTTALSNWVLSWTFANGQTIASSWNGAVSQSGANVTVSEQAGQSWQNIPANGSYSGFGFNGTWNGTTNAIPAAFSLNGTACTVN
jgi:alpha-galactosidase